MLNIIIPMSGDGLYETSSDFIYPKILTEVSNKTLLEYSQEIFDTLTEERQMIYVAPSDKLDTLGLASIITMISDGKGKIVPISGKSKGSVCSCLMAIDYLSLEDELIISSADHYINDNLQQIVTDFRCMGADAGVLTFESVHPKWSFVKINSVGMVIQAAEKNAISRTAVAGLYYFRKARYFIEAAKDLIRKDSDIQGNFYLSSCLNELVLQGKIIKCRPLNDSIYHNFYDAHAVKSFELSQSSLANSIKQLTIRYTEAFNAKDLDTTLSFFDENALLIEPDKVYSGRDNIHKVLLQLFSLHNNLSFSPVNIIAEGLKSTIQFNLSLDEKVINGVDFIEWNNKGKITQLTAYL